MAEEQSRKRVYCVRNRLEKEAAQHAQCPYCFRTLRDIIEAGERTDFCDYDPDRDPVSFGFPTDTSRIVRG